MTITNYVVILAWVTVAISLVEVYLASMQESSHEQKILQMLTTMITIQAIGWCCIMTAKDNSFAELAVHAMHFGGLLVPYSYIRFLSLVTQTPMKRSTKNLMLGGTGIILLLEFTNDYHHLMYKEIKYIKDGWGNISNNTYGPLFPFRMAWQAIYLFAIFYMLIDCARKRPILFEHIKSNLKTYVIAAFIAFFPFQVCFWFKLPYEMSAVGCTISCLFFMASLYQKNIYAMRQNTEEVLLNSSDDIILSVTDDGKLIYLNERVRTLFPETVQYVHGMQIQGRIPEIDEILNLNEKDEFNFNGNTFLCNKKPISADKEYTGAIYWLRDVTKEHEYIEKMVELKEEADKANNAKSTFLAHMSHEIRTPINAVLGMDEMILKHSREEDVKSYAADIKRAGNTLLSLVNDILDFSKIEAGKMEIICQEYNLRSCARDVALLLKFRAEAKGLELKYHFSNDLPAILWGDEVRVKQVVTNVLTNAVKYTEKGYVKTDVWCERIDEESIILHVDVKDTGIGIKKEDIPKLCTSFERTDKERNHKTEGTGLGLTITKQLLNLMHGTMSVESVYGEGSVFHIEIPQRVIGEETMDAWKELKDENEGNNESFAFTAEKARILVVDDVETNVMIATMLLEDTKATIDSVSSGEDCLEKIKTNAYDLIIMDHRMPGLSGVETLEKMRKDDSHMCKNANVIALTADAWSGAKEYYLSAGFCDYITKPLDPDLYLETVAKNLPQDLVTYN